ncbi:MAG: hypothetical protein EOM06_10180 [Sphingobacteriia bacterium]|nr:hypothetical protein [Sphingobacteriia bacterium]
MKGKGTTKKITRVSSPGNTSTATTDNSEPFVISDENKSAARKYRIFAVIAWLLAFGAEIGAIVLLNRPPVNTTWLIVLIIVGLVFVVTGSLLWKKANRLNPASEKDKFRFFVQNQLGVIIAILAFLPLVILIFNNKNLTGKQKTLTGIIAIAALVIASIVGIDFNPPSIEQYQEQTQEVKDLNNGVDHVYWTKSGRSYHLYSDCSYINTDRTDEIFEGTVVQARELKNITDLCDYCKRRALREKESVLPADTVN